MSADYINPFLNATANVISTMASTPATAGKPGLKKDTASFGVVTGVIGMASDNLTGNMVISFEEPSILGIVSKMLGEEFKAINKDVVDAVGEITNMICGGAKKELSEKGFKFDMAIPVIVEGRNVTITQLSKGPVISIPFKTDCGEFVVETNLVKR